MYGFLMEGIGDAIRRKMGESVWEKIRQKAKVDKKIFIDKKVYSETMMPRILKAAVEVTGKTTSKETKPK